MELNTIGMAIFLTLVAVGLVVIGIVWWFTDWRGALVASVVVAIIMTLLTQQTNGG